MITASSEFINDGIDVIIWNRSYIYIKEPKFQDIYATSYLLIDKIKHVRYNGQSRRQCFDCFDI